MEIQLREDSVFVEGYVNAIERNSKPLMSRIGQFIERICKGAFGKAIKRNDDIHILLNHDWKRDLGSTKQGNLELEEDNIGLHARATITDPEVVEKARAGKLVGWSFGFNDRDVETTMERGLPLREVRDLDLVEVSILDDRKRPAYEGTLVSARAENGDDTVHFIGEDMIDENIEVEESPVEREEEPIASDGEGKEETREDASQSKNSGENEGENNLEKKQNLDYSKYRNMINEMKEEK